MRYGSRGSGDGRYRTRLSENRGAGARGRHLDRAAWPEATARIERSLEDSLQLLVLNKFGKAEAEGGGLRDLVAKAVDRGIVVLIGLPARNLNAWRSFAGKFSVELSEDTTEIADWSESCGS